MIENGNAGERVNASPGEKETRTARPETNANEATKQERSALSLARPPLEWAVFPVDRQKHPTTLHGFKDASADPDAIAKMFACPGVAGVAIATGAASGVVVLDIDPRNGGDYSLDAVTQELGNLPATLESLTGGGGRHLFFRDPGGLRCSHGVLGNGLDVQADGGYVIVPPSLHASGRRYAWEGGAVPDEVPIAEFPAAWLARLRGERKAGPRGATAATDAEPIPAGMRNVRLTSFAGTMRKRGMTVDAIAAALIATNRRCVPPLDEADVRKIAESIGRYAPGDSVRDAMEAAEERDATQGESEPRIEANPEPVPEEWPEPPGREAFAGLAGEIVDAIDPHTEADRVAVLGQVLTMFGNAAGPSPHVRVGADLHHANLFAVLVGRTSRGRKGTSEREARRFFAEADHAWTVDRIAHGLSSGEGLIDAVRDPVVGEDGKTEIPGATDRRLLVVESEFGGTLRRMRQDGNTLSAVMRQAWDDGNLRTMTKRTPLRATGAHVSIIGHVTRGELLQFVDRETDNGFANRILWLSVQRSKLLPDPHSLTDAELRPLFERLDRALEVAHLTTEVRRDERATALWREGYESLSSDHPGLFGAVTSRAEAQTIRLSLLYALLDRSREIRDDHLRSALALWTFSARSARHIFGDMIGDPNADHVLRELRAIRPKGLSRTEISGLLGRNCRSADLERALAALRSLGLARSVREKAGQKGGRETERWFA